MKIIHSRIEKFDRNTMVMRCVLTRFPTTQPMPASACDPPNGWPAGGRPSVLRSDPAAEDGAAAKKPHGLPASEATRPWAWRGRRRSSPWGQFLDVGQVCLRAFSPHSLRRGRATPSTPTTGQRRFTVEFLEAKSRRRLGHDSSACEEPFRLRSRWRLSGAAPRTTTVRSTESAMRAKREHSPSLVPVEQTGFSLLEKFQIWCGAIRIGNATA